MLDEERRRRLTCAHGGMGDEPAEEGEVRRHSLDDRLLERGAQAVERLTPRRAVCDQLREQRVVGGAHLVTLLDARVDANTRRQPQPFDPSRLG